MHPRPPGWYIVIDSYSHFPGLRQYQSYISNWYINGKVFTSTNHGNPKIGLFLSSKFEFWLLTKSWNHLSFVNISPTLVIDTSIERSSRVLQHKNPKIKKNKNKKSSKFEFWLVTKSWNHLSFVNISPILVIDTSMERSSRVLQHRNPKISIFFFKKILKSSKLNFDLYFDLCWIAVITLASSISVLHL